MQNYWLVESKKEKFIVVASSLDGATKKAIKNQTFIDYKFYRFQVITNIALKELCVIDNLKIIRHAKGCRKAIYDSFNLITIFSDFSFLNDIFSVDFITLEKNLF